MPNAPTSTAELLDLIKKSGVLPPDRLAGISDLVLPPEPQKAAAVLVAQGHMTRFQAQQLLAGRHKGFRIGSYSVLDQLGRGGMGAVYLAEHLELHRKVAIKVLVPGKDEDQKLALERFLREARAAAALDHPNIVRIFDVGRHGEVPYLVMEYVEGETLQQVIDRDGSIPYPTAAEYVAQAAAGLQHAHEKQFVHRDIKPANLMRDRTGVVKILDMGLARSHATADKLTEILDKGAVVGTADFIAPEQALNQPGIDIRADIYSLGATFFALVIGKPPFEGNTTQKLLQHQLRSAPTLTSLDATLPRGLSDVVARMLAKKAADRFQTPGEVIAALSPWTGNSARIVAGVSRTSLAHASGTDLQAVVSELARAGSSRRLDGGSKPAASAARPTSEVADLGGVNDSAEVNPSDVHMEPGREAGKETGPVAAATTTREPAGRKSTSGTSPRNKKLIYAGAGVAAIALAALAGWLAFGGGTTPDTASGNRPKPEPQPAPVVPNPEPVVPPKTGTPGNVDPPPAPAERVVYHLDLAGQKPFAVRSGMTTDPADPNKKLAQVLSQTGPGQPPAGWQARVWNKDSEMEFFAADAGGRPVVGIRTVKGPGSAMLFGPRFECPTGACRLKFEYQAAVWEKKFTVKFKPNDSRLAWEVAVPTPTPTGDVWRTEDLIVDMKGATGGLFEFHNSDDRPAAAVRLRAVAVTELKLPPRGTEVPLYALDVAGIAPFRVQKERTTRVAGDPEKLPPGVGCQSWKEGASGEFRREEVDGVPVLTVTNLNDEMSGQFFFQLEGAMKLPLQPGRDYRVKVAYLTKNEAAGGVTVHVTPMYRSIGSVGMPNTGGKWATVTVPFVHPPAEDKVEVRMTIDNRSVGEGNTLCIRSVEIVEVVPPK